MKKKIAVLAGDGIGPEVMDQAVRVLREVEKKFEHSFELLPATIGGAAFDLHGEHFPEETRQICGAADAILFGSVGGPVADAHLPKWKNCEAKSILALRKAFSFNANLRPARVFSELLDITPLRPELIRDGIDIVIVRELLGDIYFGEHRTEILAGRRLATDVAQYDEDQIASIAHRAFKLARIRKKELTSVDKANVLDTSKLWRTVVTEVGKSYPDVRLTHLLVDNCAMQLVRAPGQFDVILTANLFGDILSDLASVLPGSLGLMPSASLNKEGFGLYEPSGGSAPDIAGRGIANPIAQILSAAMLLELSFGLKDEAQCIRSGVEGALRSGLRTIDLTPHNLKGDAGEAVGTVTMTDAIIERL